MGSAILNQIEEMIVHLSPDEQVGLVENLACRLRGSQRRKDPGEHAFFTRQLAATAEDPEVQDELNKIRQEFALTESDGLNNE